MTTFTAILTLFLVMDPVGNIPFFLSALRGVAPARRQKVLIRELVIAYVALLAFMFLGPYFVRVMHLRQESISIAGGIILFLISLRMVFGATGGGEELDGEPLVVPLAIPGVAGPSALATVLLLVNDDPARIFHWLFALTCAWLASAIVLLASPLFFRLLRDRGLIAMERLMGMILVTLAVQMFLDGIAHYLGRAG